MGHPIPVAREVQITSQSDGLEVIVTGELTHTSQVVLGSRTRRIYHVHNSGVHSIKLSKLTLLRISLHRFKLQAHGEVEGTFSFISYNRSRWTSQSTFRIVWQAKEGTLDLLESARNPG